MNINIIASEIQNFSIHEETEDYIISEFFDKIGKNINELETITELQKEQLIKSLFHFLKKQDSELEENFSFIHLIEDIDKPYYEIYNKELLKFNKENGTITSTLLLNRHINSLEGDERKKGVEILKSIYDNNNFAEYVRNEAYTYYKLQISEN